MSCNPTVEDFEKLYARQGVKCNKCGIFIEVPNNSIFMTQNDLIDYVLEKHNRLSSKKVV